ncbi:unnamed protein product [Caenorhabditis angaria]|uniref:Signal transducing adapter molecule 1 n=1 Tax=Caenorhabditis angaria TaxID=860376 RepID=A0A9P1I6A4_9PELO|nr:unnamed protein product [Caenorhabditis angaria]
MAFQIPPTMFSTNTKSSKKEGPKMMSYDEILEKITAPTLTTENWDGILTFCDKINGDLEGAKTGLKSLKKRLNNRDPHVVLMAISVLDSCWSNCGDRFRKEVSSSQFINELKALATNSQRLVAEKTRVSIQKWVDNECKNEPSLSLIISLYRNLKEDGYSFEINEPGKKKPIDSKYANDPNYVATAQEEDEIAKAIAASLADAEKQEKLKKNTQSLYPSAGGPSNSNSATNLGPTQNAQNSSVERKVRALYDFEAAESNELSFVAGDLIVITDESNPHWWTGRIGTQQGLFPSSFVTADLDENKIANKTSGDASSKNAGEIDAQINEAILVKCLNVLHECDPTGERADPVELAQLEAASYAQGPLIDAQLASIDRQTNSLAQVDIAIRDVLALYDDAIQKGGGYYPPPQQVPQYPPNYPPQQHYAAPGAQNYAAAPQNYPAAPGAQNLAYAASPQVQNSNPQQQYYQQQQQQNWQPQQF